MLVIGAQFFPATGAAEMRQARAREALVALSRTRTVNLQFADETYVFSGLETAAALRLDSRTVTGAAGRRKPVVSEMLTVLAGIAENSDAEWFAYVNADIEVTQTAVDRIVASARDALAFSRLDVAPVTRAPLGVNLHGIDLIAMRLEWWRRQRRRFRPYIAGEPFWDNVYAAIMCSHGNGEIVNESPGILHEHHDTSWGAGPYTEYNGLLAALDTTHFSRWTTYVARVEDSLARGGPVDREGASAAAFGKRVRWSARTALQQARAHIRFARKRLNAQ